MYREQYGEYADWSQGVKVYLATLVNGRIERLFPITETGLKRSKMNT